MKLTKLFSFYLMNKVHFTPYLGMIQHHFQIRPLSKYKVAFCSKWMEKSCWLMISYQIENRTFMRNCSGCNGILELSFIEWKNKFVIS